MNVHRIPLDAIDYTHETNGRFETDTDHVANLAAQMARSGLMHPIVVRTTAAGYEVIAGRNRVNAAHLLGWTSIAANVQQVDDQAAGTMRLAENVQRSQLSPVEEATQLHPLVESHPRGVEGVAEDIGRGVNWILDRLDLLQYPRILLNHIHLKDLSLAAAKYLAKIQPPDLRDARIEEAAHFHIDAKTARLWLQQVEASAPAEIVIPENALPAIPTTVETVTTVICIKCQERRDVRECLPTHICRPCYQTISAP
jgi:ParB family chromosome partitioning protein